jgi:hypothetical protein
MNDVKSVFQRGILRKALAREEEQCGGKQDYFADLLDFMAWIPLKLD